MPMILRPFQQKIESDIYESWKSPRVGGEPGPSNVIAVAPTGAGKTVNMSSIIKNSQKPTVSIAHRQELVSQISLALARNEIYHRIIAADPVVKFCISRHIEELGKNYHHHDAPAATAGVQTIIRRGDSLRQWASSVNIWNIDEGHHLRPENSWGKAANMFPNAFGVGFTATPTRADRKPLGRVHGGMYDHMVLGPTMRELIDTGYLSDYRLFAPTVSIDRSQIPVSEATGDLNQNALRKAAHKSTVTGDIVENYLKFANGLRGIAFVVDVEQAKEVARKFNAVGVKAMAVSAQTPGLIRQDAIRRFSRGEITVLVNVDLFGEGFDVPAVEVVMMGRPTESFGLYTQQCLDQETEILTKRGWLTYDKLLMSDTIASFNMKRKISEWVPITNGIMRPLGDDEYMCGINSPHLDIRVTNGHTMVVRSNSNATVNWMTETADQMSERKSLHRIPVASALESIVEADIKDCELELVGWFLTDGCINKITNTLQIGQSAGKPYHCSEIRRVISECGMKFGEYRFKRTGGFAHCADAISFAISKGKPRGTDKHLTGWAHLGKWFDKNIGDVFDSLSARQTRVLIIAMYLGDGDDNNSSRNWTPRTINLAMGDNETATDRLQQLCVLSGLRCNKRVYEKNGKGPWWNLRIKDVTHTTIAGKNDRDGRVAGKNPYKRSHFKIVMSRENELVWCVSNRNGTLFTRRNGKVAVLGNCGRGLRTAPGKTHGMIIDHVENYIRHGLPDAHRIWSLEQDLRGTPRGVRDPDVLPVRRCTACFRGYEAITMTCPFCGHVEEPEARNGPEFVDGDLTELTPEYLAELRGQVTNVHTWNTDFSPHDTPESRAKKINIRRRQSAMIELEGVINLWAGIETRVNGRTDGQAYSVFYHKFGVDVLHAQQLKTPDLMKLTAKIREGF